MFHQPESRLQLFANVALFQFRGTLRPLIGLGLVHVPNIPIR